MKKEGLLNAYLSQSGIWDEMRGETDVRKQYQLVCDQICALDTASLVQKETQAGELFMNQGITFTVYSDNAGIERIFPFDIIPRIITSVEWEHIENGIKQRLKALNLFLNDIYSEQLILKDRIIPTELIASCPQYTREVFGIKVPHDIYVHISGTVSYTHLTLPTILLV